MEEITKINAGKPDVCRNMRDITKELLGTSWDLETCDFALELAIEAIKRTLFSNGRLSLSGFCTFELFWRNTRKMYDPVKANGEYKVVPEHNLVRVNTTALFKKEAEKVKQKFSKFKDTRGRKSSKPNKEE